MKKFWGKAIEVDESYFSFISGAVLSMGLTICLGKDIDTIKAIAGIIAIITSFIIFMIYVCIKKFKNDYQFELRDNNRVREEEDKIWLLCYKRCSERLNRLFVVTILLFTTILFLYII